MRKGTFILIAVFLFVAAAFDAIVYSLRDPEHLHCECGIAQCPNEDYKAQPTSDSAQMHYAPYEEPFK